MNTGWVLGEVTEDCSAYNMRFSRNSMPKAPSKAAAAESMKFEEALAELDGLVSAMENGQMPLDQLLVSYQRGGELLQACRGRLQAVETQVKVLEEGQLKPWVPT
jgi:exodeoxyribonuclease VII small subunit